MFLVDIQAFYVKKRFYPKEIGILNLLTHQTAHFIIKSPFPKSLLETEDETEVTWLEHHYHGLDWNSGTTSLEEFITTFESIISSSSSIDTLGPVRIFVKGLEKANLLSTILKDIATVHTIIEITNKNIPALRKYAYQPHCLNHVFMKKNGHCALSNVMFLKNYSEFFINRFI